jgi:type VI secretion system protein ImpF
MGTIMQSLPRAPAPFFDRFSGQLDVPPGVRLSPVEALQYSLQLDLTRLFNVRNSLTIDQFLSSAPTALDYGLPDTLHLSSQSNLDRQRWESVIARAISLYEPRLIQVRVTVTPDLARPAVGRVAIVALAALGEQLCQFQFEAGLDENTVRGADA